MKEFTLQWPGKIIFGAGKLECLGEEAKALGRHAFLVTTRDLSKLGLTDRTEKILETAGVKVTRFEDVEPDPTAIAVDEAAELSVSAGCDIAVALGGGSVIDMAKGVAVAATHDGPIWDYVTYTGANAKPVTSAVLPIISIPTTAGTGSEVSIGTVLDNPETHIKAALLTPLIYSRVALIDPELTYTMPPGITAMTGFDALTHGMESYLNADKSNPVSEIMALDAVKRVAECLPRVAADGGDKEARAQLSWAATLAGTAMALSNVTVAHAMGLPLGSRTHVPHGLGLALLLPVVMEHSWREQPARYAVVADVAGATEPGMSDDEKAQALISWLRNLISDIGLADLWTGEGIDDEMLDTLTEDVFAYMGRPVSQHKPVFTRDEVRKIFCEALMKQS